MSIKNDPHPGPQTMGGVWLFGIACFALGAALSFGLSPPTLRSLFGADAGTTAEWVTGATTLGAIAVALWAAGAASRERREVERREAQLLVAYLRPEIEDNLQRFRVMPTDCKRASVSFTSPGFGQVRERIEHLLKSIRFSGFPATREVLFKLAILPDGVGSRLASLLHDIEEIKLLGEEIKRLREAHPETFELGGAHVNFCDAISRRATGIWEELEPVARQLRELDHSARREMGEARVHS